MLMYVKKHERLRFLLGLWEWCIQALQYKVMYMKSIINENQSHTKIKSIVVNFYVVSNVSITDHNFKTLSRLMQF